MIPFTNDSTKGSDLPEGIFLNLPPALTHSFCPKDVFLLDVGAKPLQQSSELAGHVSC